MKESTPERKEINPEEFIEQALQAINICIDVELSDLEDEVAFIKGLDALSIIVNFYNNLSKVVNKESMDKVETLLELLDGIIAPEEEGFEEFQEGMDVLSNILKALYE